MCIRDRFRTIDLTQVTFFSVFDLCTIPRIISSLDWGSMCSLRYEGPFMDMSGSFRFLLPLSCPPPSTSPGEGLPGVPLEGACGRRKRGIMRNRLNIGTFMPLQNMKCSSEGGVEKYSIVLTITSNSTICAGTFIDF